MPTIRNASLKGILVLAGVAIVTAAVGFVTTAQLAAGTRLGQEQKQTEPGGQRGFGPMGRGMMGPGGPRMRGGPGGPFGMGPACRCASSSYLGLCHSVMPNERQALDLLVGHLTQLGHKHVAWLRGNKPLRQNATRRSASRRRCGNGT